MRTRKAFIAGLGTTGALMAAMACTFAIVSSIVAFEGWPSLHLGRSATTLEDGGTLSTTAADSGLPLASPAVDGRVDTAGSSRHAQRVGALGDRRVRGSGDDVLGGDGQAVVKDVTGSGGLDSSAGPAADVPPAHTSDRDGAGSGKAGGDPDPAAAAEPPSAQPPAAGGTSPGSSGDGGVGEAVDQVTTVAGTTVGQTGAALGATVGATTGQLGAVAGQVSPVLGQKVAQTGQAVGGAVTGTTGTVGQVVQGTGGVVGGLLGGLGKHRAAASH